MELNILESWLYQAANILRGPVDQSDFKAYIFPMLFLKRISNVYDEELNECIERFGVDFEQSHRFIIPEGCHWNDIKETSSNVGTKIHECIRKIESANPDKLYGIFGDTQWSNKNKLTDELLKDLIDHFSKHNLGNKEVQSNTMGLAYEYLIKKFADDSNKSAGEFYTPREVVKLMTMILDPKAGDSIYDPACGTGGMLLECYEHVKQSGGDARTLKLYGQEKNLTTSSIARINMFLHDIEDFEIKRGDTLREPMFHEDDQLKTFDCVIANPPFSLKNWGREEWSNDPYGRNSFGVPPASFGDYAWVEHMLKSLKSNGKMTVVLPQGVLFRGASEGKIRKIIIDNDLIETVIGLGEGLFYGTNISTCIVVLNKNKEIEKKKKIQIIDASEIYKKERSQNYLEKGHLENIYNIYNEYKDIDNKSKIASMKDIIESDYNLNIALYVDKVDNEDNNISLEEAYKDMVEALEESEKAEKTIKILLRELGAM